MVAGVPPRFNTRSSNILLITAAVLAPLSLLEDLTKLAFTSMVGCLAVLYTVLFIARRALDGSYVSGEEHRPKPSPNPSPSPNPNPIPVHVPNPNPIPSLNPHPHPRCCSPHSRQTRQSEPSTAPPGWTRPPRPPRPPRREGG